MLFRSHISNTPKQILLYEAFGRPTPRFAHVPLILGPDKKRLSKRHGATSVMEYPRLGYLPEAMVNFLALLGWSPGNDQELLTRDELIAHFTLNGISGGNAVFNPEKLDWFNQQYIMRLPGEELARRLEPLLRESGLWKDSYGSSQRQWLIKVIELLKPRVRRLTQFVEEGAFFFRDSIDFDEAAVSRHLKTNGMREHVEALRRSIGESQPFTAEALEGTVRGLATERGVKAGVLIHATRVAVTGRANSPGLFEVVELLGRDRATARLSAVIPLASE